MALQAAAAETDQNRTTFKHVMYVYVQPKRGLCALSCVAATPQQPQQAGGSETQVRPAFPCSNLSPPKWIPSVVVRDS
ncbi:unnamed protein product [Calypogeia fissa]